MTPGDLFCLCGIRLRRMFDDMYSCPRCKTIIVSKDGVSLTWSGKIALVLLDKMELYCTQLLLENRDKCNRKTDEDEEAPPPEIYKAALLSEGKRITECVNCRYPVEDKCGAKCPSCKTLQPCSTER